MNDLIDKIQEKHLLQQRMRNYTKFKVSGEAVFQVWNGNFGISPSASGYTLKFSFDKTNFTAAGDATPANENLAVVAAPAGAYFKLVGNTGDVWISYTVE